MVRQVAFKFDESIELMVICEGYDPHAVLVCNHATTNVKRLGKAASCCAQPNRPFVGRKHLLIDACPNTSGFQRRAAS